jgi:peptide/nickel transport system substrate-binding protein
VLVRDDAPWLVELARAVAASLSRGGHELTVRALAPADLALRRARRAFVLAVDVARPLAPGPVGALVGLAVADASLAASDLVRHPPRLAPDTPVRTLTRTLRVGVLGEIRIQGGRIADLTLPTTPFGWDLGGATLTSTRS